MGNEVAVVPGLLHAVRGEWNKINNSVWHKECQNSRRGSDKHPGSDNIIPLAWAIAFVAAIRQPNRLPSWLNKGEVFNWWKRELETRLNSGLMLQEERSRIYFGWHWAPIYVIWRLATSTDIKNMAQEWLVAQLAQMALCGVRVKPQRYNPQIKAKLFSGRLCIPLCGARSWSADDADGKPGREAAHHMGSTAFESVALAMIFNQWNQPQPAHTWELSVMTELGRIRPMNEEDRIIMRDTINSPLSLLRAELDRLVNLAGRARWPAYLVRFSEGGAACVGSGHGFGVSTAPLYAMAEDKTGTVFFLALDSGARQAHNINYEPCGLSYSIQGDSVTDVFAWAGGDDLPRKILSFPYNKWGDVVYIVHVTKRGTKVIWPQMSPPPPTIPPPPSSEEEDDDSTIDKIVDIITAPFRFIRDILGL